MGQGPFCSVISRNCVKMTIRSRAQSGSPDPELGIVMEAGAVTRLLRVLVDYFTDDQTVKSPSDEEWCHQS